MQKSGLYLILILGLLEMAELWAQQPGWYFDQINLEQGLSQGTINCMLQDQKGLLWIGTQDGLNKFDGYSFSVYRYHNTDTLSISDNWITSLYEDHQGFIWVGTLSGGLNRFDRTTGSFKQYRQIEDVDYTIPSDHIRHITEDRAGALWIASDLGLSMKGIQGFINYRFSSISSDPPDINFLFNSPDGSLWIGSNQGLYRFNYQSDQIEVMPIKGLPDIDFRAALVMDKDDVLIGGHPGLYRLSQEAGEWVAKEITHDKITDNLVNAMEQDSNGNWWIGYDTEGIIVWNGKESIASIRYEPTQNQSLTNDKVHEILNGKFGNIWIGTLNGINRYNMGNRKFDLYQNIPGLSGHSGNSIFGITTDKQGYLWTATRAGIFRTDQQTAQVQKFDSESNPPLQANSFRSVYRDNEGLIWIGSATGSLDILDPATMKVTQLQLSHSGSGNAIYSIFESSQGDLYLGTTSGLYQKSHESDQWQHYPMEEIRAISEDRNHNLWIGTLGAGMYKFIPETQQFQQFRHQPDDPHSLSHDIVACIYVDPGDTLWIGTASGFNRYHPQDGKFEHYNIGQGLPGEVVYGILPDNEGKLWLSTNNGLTEYNRLEDSFRTYYTSDGLQGNEFNAGAFHQSQEGKLYFGGLNGVNAFHPGSIKNHPLLPEIVLTGFKVLNEDRTLKQSLESIQSIGLTYKDYFFSFEFSAVHLAAPEHNRYAYKMEGFDQDWIYTDRRFASYTNLDPGDYKFKVIASNSDGVWTDEELVIDIHIAPPFWKTWWFYLIAALLILGMIYFAYRFRIAQIRKQEEIKTEFNRRISEVEMKALRSQMNPHFLFNCLNSINRYIVKSDPETASGYLTKFSRLIRLILQNSKSATIPLIQELEALTLYIEMEELRFENKFDYQIQIGDQVEADYIEVPPMMIQPYVENAIWHGLMHKTEKGSLLIDIQREEQTLICVVEDNGIGRKKAGELKTKSATKNKSLGMKITSDRLAIINNLHHKRSVVQVEDLVDETGLPMGTRVTLKIPVEIDSWEIKPV